MANAENLIPLNQRTKSEQREIQSQGGIASGAARREYRSLKQAAKAFFKENGSAAMEIVLALYREGLNGNVRAVEKLEDLAGETVQREALALQKKQCKAQEKTDNGKLTALLEGLQDDLHEETVAADDAVENETA